MFEDHPDAYYIFLGDLFHSITMGDKRWPTEVRPEYYEHKKLLNVAKEEVTDLINEFRKRLDAQWIKNHVLGAISGNHPLSLALRGAGYEPHDEFCKEMGIQNLGYSCFLPINLVVRSSLRRRQIIIYAHHGFGGGSRTEGADLTKYSRHAWQYEADICLYGHSHNKFVKKLPRVSYVNSDPPRIREEVRVLAATGTFQKTLSDSETPSWAETRGFPVRDLGYVIIHITLRREQPYLNDYIIKDGRPQKKRQDLAWVELTVEE